MRLLPVVLLTLAVSCSTFGQTYTITTVAGTGQPGYCCDAGPATAAQVYQPTGVAVDSAGTVYIADTNNGLIRKISNGTITTFAGGGGKAPLYADNGPATLAKLYQPNSVTVDSAGNLYISDAGSNSVRKVTVATGVITTVAGGGPADPNFGDNGPATSAILNRPSGVGVDSSGNVYIADAGNQRVRKVTVSTGIITSIAGSATQGFSGDNGPATSAQLSNPTGVAVDSAGNVYIADTNNQRIRKVSASGGVITTFAGGGPNPPGMADGGPATNAELYQPNGITVDTASNLYIADAGSNSVRKVAVGVITTVAGTGTQGFAGDGGPGSSAQLNYPEGVGVSVSGVVYIADTMNSRIRAATPSGPPCTYTVSPTALQAPFAGGNLSVSIQTGASCPWTVLGLPGWITISGGVASGSGPATVTLVAAANSGTALSATVVVAGVSVTITQSTVSQPTVTALVNAANYQSGPISPGEIVTLGGSNLGPSTGVGLALDSSGKVSTQIGGVQVLFSGYAAPLTYVSALQINAVVPYEVQGLLSPTVQVKYQGQVSNAFALTAAAAAPALFTFNGSGSGPVAALNQNGTYNAPNSPAPKGSYITLYLTGEGQTSPPGVTGKVTTVAATGPLTPQPLLAVAVMIGGQPANVSFYGEAPGLVSGVMQLNVQIPTNVASGDLPISVSVGTNTSPSNVTVSVQ